MSRKRQEPRSLPASLQVHVPLPITLFPSKRCPSVPSHSKWKKQYDPRAAMYPSHCYSPTPDQPVLNHALTSSVHGCNVEQHEVGLRVNFDPSANTSSFYLTSSEVPSETWLELPEKSSYTLSTLSSWSQPDLTYYPLPAQRTDSSMIDTYSEHPCQRTDQMLNQILPFEAESGTVSPTCPSTTFV